MHLRVVNSSLVSADFLVGFVTEDVLVAQHIFDLALVDGHALGVSVIHGTALVTVAVLHSVVFLLGKLGKTYQFGLIVQILHEAFIS